MAQPDSWVGGKVVEGSGSKETNYNSISAVQEIVNGVLD